MKNKILIVSLLIISLSLSGGVYAEGGNGNGDNNNGTDNQNSEQENENGDSVVQNQNQNENQIQNEGEDSQVQAQNAETEQEGTPSARESGFLNASSRRSEVANAVQEMLQISERNMGVGMEIRIIAQTQTQTHAELEASLEKIQNRSRFLKFLIGPDYNEVKNAEGMLAQNQEKITELVQLQNQLENLEDEIQLAEQIQVLEQANLEIQNSLTDSQKGFSLLGWLFKFFANNK